MLEKAINECVISSQMQVKVCSDCGQEACEVMGMCTFVQTVEV